MQPPNGRRHGPGPRTKRDAIAGPVGGQRRETKVLSLATRSRIAVGYWLHGYDVAESMLASHLRSPRQPAPDNVSRDGGGTATKAPKFLGHLGQCFGWRARPMGAHFAHGVAVFHLAGVGPPAIPATRR